jgi:hypothetical protein
MKLREKLFPVCDMMNRVCRIDEIMAALFNSQLLAYSYDSFNLDAVPSA